MGWSIFKSKGKKEVEFKETMAERHRKWKESQMKLKLEYENPPIDEPVKAIIRALGERPNTFGMKTYKQREYLVSGTIVAGYYEITDRKTKLKLTMQSKEALAPYNSTVIIKHDSEYFRVRLNQSVLLRNGNPIAREVWIPYHKVSTEFELSGDEKVHLSMALQEFIKSKCEATQKRWNQRKRNRYIKMYSDLED